MTYLANNWPWMLYVAGVVLSVRLCIRALRREMVDSFRSLPTEWTDVFACLFFGLFAAAAWPLWCLPVLTAYVMRRRLDGPDEVLRFFGGQSKRERLRKQEQHIAELERELNLR